MTDTRTEITADEAIERIGIRAEELKDDYTRQLDEFTDKIVPKTLSNSEYAARCSALMTALNRQLARCAASFGEVHGVDIDEMQTVVVLAFRRNFAICHAALEGAGESVQ